MKADSKNQKAEIEAWCAARNAEKDAALATLRETNARLKAILHEKLGPPPVHQDTRRRTRHATVLQTIQAVADCGGDKRAAAALLGIDLSQVYRRLKTPLTSDLRPLTSTPT